MKKSFLFRVLLLVVVISALGLTALADVVTTGNVNLRTGPGKGYSIVTAVDSGTHLTYLGETSTDERGVEWYKVQYGSVCWVSSKYAYVTGNNSVSGNSKTGNSSGSGSYAPGQATELSNYRFTDLKKAAPFLGIYEFRVVNSEVPNQYYNSRAMLAGYSDVECICVTGSGFSLFGVQVGMTAQQAESALYAAGLDYNGEYGNLITFEHPTDNKSFYDSDGYDSNVNVYLSNGTVSRVEWNSYTG